MTPRKTLQPGLEVTGQLTADDFQALAADGVRTVINNRPDGEEPGQIPAAEAARIASSLGMAYHHIPVVTSSLDAEAAGRFGAAVASSEAPVVAHCRTGTRSANLWLLDRLGRGDVSRSDAEHWAATNDVDAAPALRAFDKAPPR